VSPFPNHGCLALWWVLMNPAPLSQAIQFAPMIALAFFFVNPQFSLLYNTQIFLKVKQIKLCKLAQTNLMIISFSS
jgi:hypothetical protein